jgi:hypothetical protein
MRNTRTRWVLGLFVSLVVAASFGCKKEGLKINEIDPPFGNIAGNDDVVITGHGFEPGLVVTFRKRKATKVVIESDTKVRVKTPPGPEGPVDVVVTQPSGKSFVLEDAFTYRRESGS